MRPPTLATSLLATVAVAFTLYSTPPVAAQGGAQGGEVIITGLNFPWGMAEHLDGSILVAESGSPPGKISRHYPDGTSEDFVTDIFDVRGVTEVEIAANPETIIFAYWQSTRDTISFVDLEGNEFFPDVEFPAPIGFVQDEGSGRLFGGSFAPAKLSEFEISGTPPVVNLVEDVWESESSIDFFQPLRLEFLPLGGEVSFLVVQSFAGQITQVFLDGSSELFATVEGGMNGGIVALDDGSVLVTVGGINNSQGRVVRIYRDGTQEDFATGLRYPRGLLVRSDGHVLVSLYNGPSSGSVVDLGVVPVDSEEGPASPAKLSVSAPSPNPASGTLRFEVRTAEPSRVRAEVYDVLGRLVDVVFDAAVVESTEIRVEPEGWAPGLYVMRVTGASASETRRFTVVR